MFDMGITAIAYMTLWFSSPPKQYLSMPQFNKAGNNSQSNTSDSAPLMTQETNAVPAAYDRSTKLPDHIEALKRNGNDFLENEKYLAAIYQYTMAIHLLPNHPVAYLNRATAYMRRNWYGDVYAGLRDCQTALKLDPTYVKAHFRLARALFELGYVDEASDCLHELKKRFPTHANNNGVQMLTKDIQIQQTKNESMDTSDASDEHVTELSTNEMVMRSGRRNLWPMTNPLMYFHFIRSIGERGL